MLLSYLHLRYFFNSQEIKKLSKGCHFIVEELYNKNVSEAVKIHKKF